MLPASPKGIITFVIVVCMSSGNVLSIIVGMLLLLILWAIGGPIWDIASTIVKIVVYLVYVIPMLLARGANYFDLWPSTWPFPEFY